jgi:hypothetical protein
MHNHSKIMGIQISEVYSKLVLVDVGPWIFVRWRDEQLREKQKYESGGRLRVKIYILSYGDNLSTIATTGIKFDLLKYHSRISHFYLNYIFLTKILNMTMTWNFVVMCGQTMDHFVQIFFLRCSILLSKLTLSVYPSLCPPLIILEPIGSICFNWYSIVE